MAQVDEQENLLTTQVANLTINSAQRGLESVAEDSMLRDFAPREPSNIPELQCANIDVQMAETNDETEEKVLENAKIPRPKFGWTKGGRKAFHIYVTEERKQIAMGTLSNAEIPAAVAAALRETKQRSNQERRQRKKLERQASKYKASNEPQAGTSMDTSGKDEDDGLQCSHDSQTPSQIEDSTLDQAIEMD